MIVSYNFQCGLCVLQIVWVKQRRSTMVRYSFQVQAKMFMYGQVDGNSWEAAWMYWATYPHRQHHSHHTIFGAIKWCLYEHESFETDERARQPQTVHTPDVKERVLHDIENKPATSFRQVSRQHGVSQSTVICILHDNCYYPITSNMCRGYHRWIFLHGKDSVAGLCNRLSALWDFCLRSSSPMKQPLVEMASLTCIIIICRL